MTAPDVVQKRNEWVTNIDAYNPDTLVFLDESGVNIDMTRRYGRAVGKARAVDKTPENTPTQTSHTQNSLKAPKIRQKQNKKIA